MNPLFWAAIGLIVGWLASQIVKGGPYGAVGDIGAGVAGALAGGYLAGTMSAGQLVSSGSQAGWLIAGAGAALLIFLSHALPVRLHIG